MSEEKPEPKLKPGFFLLTKSSLAGISITGFIGQWKEKYPADDLRDVTNWTNEHCSVIDVATDIGASNGFARAKEIWQQISTGPFPFRKEATVVINTHFQSAQVA